MPKKNLRSRIDYIDVATMTSRDACIANVGIELFGHDYYTTATSKRDPLDRSDNEIAELIALGRALEALGKKMQKRAAGMTKHSDDMRMYRKAQIVKRKLENPDDEPGTDTRDGGRAVIPGQAAERRQRSRTRSFPVART